jgi:phosphoribosylamine--glycine ligase
VNPRHRIVVAGRGGREHALAWRLARDPGVEWVKLAPGNAATAAAFGALTVDETDPVALTAACGAAGTTLVVIGPEASLAAGAVDALTTAGIPAFGPNREAARIESSKWFAKEIMAAAGVPTARAVRCTDVATALAALGTDFAPPWVIKADGLAAGKGVLVSSERTEAEAFLRACLESGRFGAGGNVVVIEEHLAGEELSVMAVCDGSAHVLLPSARDHKRALDGDRGANTGGMGAFAPSPRFDPALADEVSRRVIAPVLAELAARRMPFRGTLYAGLMLTAAGAKVLEFNARFGDPETQVVMPLIEGSFADLLAGAARGALDRTAFRTGAGATVGVALVDGGYPEKTQGDGVIEGLDRIATQPDRFVFHAGTAPDARGWQVTGGRAATVVARAASVAAARAGAYHAIDTLGGFGWRCRRDIAADVAVPVSGGRT